MEMLDNKYQVELDSIKGAIQSSDLLVTYLETEEEEDYQALREAFEPSIEALYEKVASENPLQLISLEEKLLDPGFEGLYVTRILGYSVLRGEIDELYRYKRPQNHFKKVLLAICASPNFDLIQMRIGQGVQIGFGLSSNIWITNLIEQVEGKRVKAFLESQVLDKYREVEHRRIAYARYQNQFSINYHSAEFPTTTGELKVLFSSLKHFLMHRAEIKANNSSLLPNLVAFLNNEQFKYGKEYVQVLSLFANFYEPGEHAGWLRDTFNTARNQYGAFNDDYFGFQEELLNSDLEVDAAADTRVSALVDKSVEDDLAAYYRLMDEIHTKGYVHDDVIEAVRAFYDQHEGLSTINECLRRSILGHFRRLLTNLSEEAYADYFEMNKVFALYIQIFNNQQFNQDVKKYSLEYVAKLLKRYTDKRGKDYQEIKRFVSQTFLDLGFMKEKEIVELFKTRRKKRKTTA
ncbi:MAG: hypothetical protein R3301_00040 [Saprospiraceae bacterium]|nr:hypothetical protein [Saprospiraceae bacterium]